MGLLFRGAMHHERTECHIYKIHLKIHVLNLYKTFVWTDICKLIDTILSNEECEIIGRNELICTILFNLYNVLLTFN